MIAVGSATAKDNSMKLAARAGVVRSTAVISMTLPRPSKIDLEPDPADQGPAVAPRRRRLAVVGGEVPLHLHVRVEEPVHAEHDVVQRAAVDAAAPQVEVAVAEAHPTRTRCSVPLALAVAR